MLYKTNFPIELKKDQSHDWSFNFHDTNCLIVTPTHDAYLENGTNIGLTVGIHIIAYTFMPVNIPQKFTLEIQK